jgi:AAA15 family ATPase/GTPase
LDWLGDDRLEQLLEFVNPKLFLTTDKALNKPQRETLMASVTTPNGPHPLSGLSHGERALLQLFVRTACHMTRNTIVLIDEIETHLHTTWMNRMFQALKVLVGDSRLSVIFSTHNRELIEVFDHMRPEPKLAKGGYLIEDEIV